MNNTYMTVSPTRARTIIDECNGLHQFSIIVGADGSRTYTGGMSWSAHIDKVITPQEREFLTELWKTLPGSYSFADTISYLARQTR